MAAAPGLTGKMAPLNWLATRLWSRAKPIESRRREAPITAIERGENTGSRGRAGRSDWTDDPSDRSDRSDADFIALTSHFREEHPQLLRGQAHLDRQPLLAEVAVDLGRDALRAAQQDLVHLADLHVRAPRVGRAHQVEDEAEGLPAAAAAEEDELEPVVVRPGSGGEAEGAGIERNVGDRGEGGAEALAVGDHLDVGIAVAPPLPEPLPDDGGLAEAPLELHVERGQHGGVQAG